jgi:hypothetical protein
MEMVVQIGPVMLTEVQSLDVQKWRLLCLRGKLPFFIVSTGD